MKLYTGIHGPRVHPNISHDDLAKFCLDAPIDRRFFCCCFFFFIYTPFHGFKRKDPADFAHTMVTVSELPAWSAISY